MVIPSTRTASAVALAALLSAPLASQADDTLPLRVIDSQGTVVGRLNGENAFMVVSGVNVEVGLKQGRDGLRWKVPDGDLWFDSTDCTGVAYLLKKRLSPKVFGTMPSTLVGRQGGPTLYFGHSDSYQSLTGPWHSTLNRAGRCRVIEVGGPQEVWVLDQSTNLGVLFSMPMHVQ